MFIGLIRDVIEADLKLSTLKSLLLPTLTAIFNFSKN